MSRYFYIEDSGDIYEMDGADGSTSFLYSGPTRFADAYNNEITTNFGSFDGKLAYITDNAAPGAVEFAVVDVDAASHATVVFDIPWAPFNGNNLYTAWTADGRCVLVAEGDLYGLDLTSGQVLWTRVTSVTSRVVGDRVDAVYARGVDTTGTWRIDPDDGSTIWSATGNIYHHGIAADTTGSYTRYFLDDSIRKLDRDTGQEVWGTTVTEDRRFSAGGGRFMSAYGTTGDVLDTSDGSIIYQTNGGLFTGTPRRVFVDEHIMATIGAWGEIAVYDRDTATRLWNTNTNARGLIALVEASSGPPSPVEADSTVAGAAALSHVEASAAVQGAARADSIAFGTASIPEVAASGSLEGDAPPIEWPTSNLVETAVQVLLKKDTESGLFFVDRDTGQTNKLLFDKPIGHIFSRQDTALVDDEAVYHTFISSNTRSLHRLHLITGESHLLFNRSITSEQAASGQTVGDGYATLSDGDILWIRRIKEETPFDRDFQILRLTPSGGVQWAAVIEGIRSIRARSKGNTVYIETSDGTTWTTTRYDMATGEPVYSMAMPFIYTVGDDGLYGTVQIGDGFWTLTKWDHSGSVIWETSISGAAIRTMTSDEHRVYVAMNAWDGSTGYPRIAAYADNTGTLLWENTGIDSVGFEAAAMAREDVLVIGRKRIDQASGDLLWTTPDHDFFILRKLTGVDPLDLDPTAWVVDGITRNTVGERISATAASVGMGGGFAAVSEAGTGRWTVDRGSGTGESVVLSYTYSGGNWEVSAPVVRGAAT